MSLSNPTTSVATSVSSSGQRVVTTTTYTYDSDVVAKTADYAVLATDTGKTFTTRGAAGAVAFTLPSGESGLRYRFVAVAAQTMTIVGAAGTVKGPGTLSGATITVNGGTGSVTFTSVELLCDGTNWLIVNSQGTVASVG